MQFQLFHKDFFKAIDGAYSKVTSREEFDSQLTLTDVECDMIINYFGIDNIQVGNVSNNPLKAKKRFLFYPSLLEITLNLVYPKPNKSELRLYLSKNAGFKPLGGEIWYLYIDNNKQLVIGSLKENLWNDLGQADIQDDDYLEKIQDVIQANEVIINIPEGKIIPTNLGSRIVYQRNPLIAIARLSYAGFVCEIDESHQTFISQKTKNLYVEAHHFVPMKFQNSFTFPLDSFNNIISLCPNCHKGIHLGEVGHKRILIDSIFSSREVINNFTKDNIYSFYNSLPTNLA